MKKIAVLGPQHTYSDLASDLYQNISKQDLTKVYGKHIKETLDLMDQSDYAILPIENTLEGYIGTHIDLLIEHQLSVDYEIKLDIDFSLVSHVPFEKIEKVYVQYAAKNQCLKFIETLGDCPIVITDSNVYAYDAYIKDEMSAAIVPTHLIKDGDQVIKKHISDEKDNHTRFLVLKKEKNVFKKYHQTDDIKASLVVSPKVDRPGLLFDILKVFSKHQINLISIMSRPTKKKIGTYHFYLELEGKNSEVSKIYDVIDDLKVAFPLELVGLYQAS